MTSQTEEFADQPNHSYEIIQSDDDIGLYLRKWSPNTSSDLAIILSHGICAHSGSYQEIGNYLSNLGYTTYGFDLRGHGLSEGKSGDLRNSDVIKSDIENVIYAVKKNHDTLVLLGHSMGVTTALLMYQYCEDTIDGLIFLSGRIKVPNAMIPQFSIFQKMKVFAYSKLFPDKPVINLDFIEEIITTDELFTYNYTRRFFSNMEIGTLMLPNTIDIPVLVLIGDKDELWNVNEIEEFYQRLPCEKKRFQVISDMRHAVFTKEQLEQSGIENWL